MIIRTRSFSVNPKVEGENHSRSAVSKNKQTSSIGFLIHLDAWFELQQILLSMSTCLNALSCCYMTDCCFNKQLSRCSVPNKVASEYIGTHILYTHTHIYRVYILGFYIY